VYKCCLLLLLVLLQQADCKDGVNPMMSHQLCTEWSSGHRICKASTTHNLCTAASPTKQKHLLLEMDAAGAFVDNGLKLLYNPPGICPPSWAPARCSSPTSNTAPARAQGCTYTHTLAPRHQPHPSHAHGRRRSGPI